MSKKNNVNVGAVFTTHATILGRTLASNNFDLYGSSGDGKMKIEAIDPIKEAYNYYIEAKYGIEKACVNNADVFTTVSEITGIEAEFLLKKKPDVLLPNGLDMKRFPTFEEISIKHNVAKAQIKEFLLTFFFPYYTFDLDETLLFFLAGRYEFRDKGIDIYIKALGQLNDRMKAEKSKKTIVAFIWVPSSVRGIKPSLLENRTFYNDVKESIEENTQDIQKKLMYYLLANIELSSKNIFDEETQKMLKKKLLMFRKKGSPEICTHDLYDENDEIKKAVLQVGLDNAQDDKVKIVYYPIYLTGADNLLDTDYYESMIGCHLGVFPSLYEPWGYTPLEAGALGASAVTTDLAGFGRFIDKKKAPDDKGIFVLKRLNKKDDEIIKSLSDFMFWFQALDKYDRVQNNLDARNLAAMADWKILIENYINAHNLAVKKKFGIG
jgi:glycogen(starch) synthase